MKIDNPTAFPSSAFERGMTLRDYFAGQALAGHMARSNVSEPMNPSDAAAAFYSIADFMLIERAKASSKA